MKRLLSAFSAASVALAAFSASVQEFAGPAVNSVRGFLSPAEISRCYLTALGSSTALGFATTFLSTLGADAQVSTAAGIWVAFLFFLAIHAAELLRRLDHGQAPAPATAPAQKLTFFDPDFRDLTPDEVKTFDSLKAEVDARSVPKSYTLLTDRARPGSIDKTNATTLLNPPTR